MEKTKKLSGSGCCDNTNAPSPGPEEDDSGCCASTVPSQPVGDSCVVPSSCCGDLGKVLSPKLFKALCDPNRVSILTRLAECCTPSTVSQIAECCPINISVVSRHLATLKEAGILAAEKRGKHVFYRVRGQELAKILRNIADCIEDCCGDAAQARATIEKEKVNV